MGIEAVDPGRRRVARAVRGARRGLLRQGLRRHLPWPSAHASGGGHARPTASRSPRVRLVGALPYAPASYRARDRRLGAGRAEPLAAGRCRSRRTHPGSRSFRSPRARSSYDGLLVFVFIALGALLRTRYPPLGLARAAPGGGLGLRRARPEPGDAVHRRQFCAAHPQGFRDVRVPRPRKRRYAAARRHERRRASRPCADPCGRALAPVAGAVDFAAERLNHLQFLTIRRYLSLVFFALSLLLLVGAMALILGSLIQGIADAPRARARAAAARLTAR